MILRRYIDWLVNSMSKTYVSKNHWQAYDALIFWIYIRNVCLWYWIDQTQYRTNNFPRARLTVTVTGLLQGFGLRTIIIPVDGTRDNNTGKVTTEISSNYCFLVVGISGDSYILCTYNYRDSNINFNESEKFIG